jgi:hypothetical protein
MIVEGLKRGPWKCVSCGRILESNEKPSLSCCKGDGSDHRHWCGICMPPVWDKDDSDELDPADWWKQR